MRVALTGADGFTGRYVIKALEAAGADWLVINADLTDTTALDRAVAGAGFDRLIHLAGRAFVNARDWQSFYAVNQIGTFNLLEAVARHQPNARCILASSAQVYGPGAQGLIDEHAPPSPANHYAISKYAMEQGAALWRDRLDISITRPFNYTGLGQTTDYLIPKLVDNFRRRAAVIELGNTWVKRDFGDVRSVAAAYVGLATGSTPPATLNIATGHVVSVDELLALLCDITGHSVEVRTNPAFVRTNDVPVLGGAATRLREAVPGWEPHALVDTLRWMHAGA